jgi:hypothetical protein
MQEPRKNKTGSHMPKPGTNSAVDGLTCSEVQIEDLLSEGESTETERKVPVRTSKQVVRKTSVRA